MNNIYTVNAELLSEAMTKKGFKSMGALAKDLGLHRNTLSNYLRGAPVLQEAFEKIVSRLEVEPGQLIIKRRDQAKIPALAISPLVSQICLAAPDCALFLFGSRARNKAKKYSDYDLGIFVEVGLPFQRYSRLLDLVANWNEKHTSTVQLVNLSSADSEFLKEIVPDLVFLAGNFLERGRIFSRAGAIISE